MLLSLTMLLIVSLLFSSSPLKLSLTLAALSTLMGMFSYQLTNSIFIPCALIISFSSGMMILFSYCSMLSNHESKSKIKPSVLILTPIALSMLTMVTTPSSYENMMQKMTVETPQSLLLVFLMAVVIISMVCINLSFFNPTKKFMQSY